MKLICSARKFNNMMYMHGGNMVSLPAIRYVIDFKLFNDANTSNNPSLLAFENLTSFLDVLSFVTAFENHQL